MRELVEEALEEVFFDHQWDERLKFFLSLPGAPHISGLVEWPSYLGTTIGSVHWRIKQNRKVLEDSIFMKNRMWKLFKECC